MNKKLIIGVAVGAVVLVGGYFGYKYFKKKSEKKTSPPTTPTASVIGGRPVRVASPEQIARQSA